MTYRNPSLEMPAKTMADTLPPSRPSSLRISYLRNRFAGSYFSLGKPNMRGVASGGDGYGGQVGSVIDCNQSAVRAVAGRESHNDSPVPPRPKDVATRQDTSQISVDVDHCARATADLSTYLIGHMHTGRNNSLVNMTRFPKFANDRSSILERPPRRHASRSRESKKGAYVPKLKEDQQREKNACQVLLL